MLFWIVQTGITSLENNFSQCKLGFLRWADQCYKSILISHALLIKLSCCIVCRALLLIVHHSTLLPYDIIDQSS
uniref:Uncharacterized protein n=1 Tax=Arundo donax TaxID=35708 RepID=A0A0A9G8T9_ARUDO